ncbi:hypothetical protein L209DRAFT_400238 [Thermothelomyces heterothallicus CBS 203.75]
MDWLLEVARILLAVGRSSGSSADMFVGCHILPITKPPPAPSLYFWPPLAHPGWPTTGLAAKQATHSGHSLSLSPPSSWGQRTREDPVLWDAALPHVMDFEPTLSKDLALMLPHQTARRILCVQTGPSPASDCAKAVQRHGRTACPHLVFH